MSRDRPSPPPKTTKGYTLLEAVIALSVWLVLAAGAASVLLYASRNSERLISQSDAFENARVSLDALIVSIQMAGSMRIEVGEGHVLKKMAPVKPDGSSVSPDYEFTFKMDAGPDEASYQQLRLGNNEFASRIILITVKKAGEDRVTITVTAGGYSGEPVEVSGSADVRYKKVEIIQTS
jgi:type II secretory pathway pseudopilin PulG